MRNEISNPSWRENPVSQYYISVFSLQAEWLPEFSWTQTKRSHSSTLICIRQPRSLSQCVGLFSSPCQLSLVHPTFSILSSQTVLGSHMPAHKIYIMLPSGACQTYMNYKLSMDEINNLVESSGLVEIVMALSRIWKPLKKVISLQYHFSRGFFWFM